MRKILIPPRFSRFEKLLRAHVVTAVTDFLLENEFLPIMPFEHTNLNNEAEALKAAHHYLEGVHGLILQGGSDVCPTLYDQKNLSAKEVQLHRDLFEMALIKGCLERNIPILGLCRGMQLINVVLGGTLHQTLLNGDFVKHIDFIDENSENFTMDNLKDCSHDIELRKGGKLHSVYKKPKISVNSFHHQGIDRMADGLNVEAQSEDGLIEAFSSDEKRILGVQWHPELDLKHANNGRIFRLWLTWCQG